MKILIVGLNYAPELTGIGKYTAEMAEWLAHRGHSVKVVTTPPYYPAWDVPAPYSKFRYRRDVLQSVIVIRCPLYVPKKKVTTFKRLAHLLSFGLSSIPPLLMQIAWRPDVVINPVPTLISSPVSLLVARATGATSVLHIQDFEIDAMLGLGMARSGALARIAAGFEKLLLRAFQRVTTISASMAEKAIEKGAEPADVSIFPNWSNLSDFSGATSDKPFRQRIGVPMGHKLVLYSGNIGEKQGLETVLDAADLLKDKPYQFLIIGEGAGKSTLERAAKKKSLRNLSFLPLQPAQFLPTLLASADCHLVIQKKGLGDAVLPSKLTNILAVGGNAVITAEAGTELATLCKQYPGIATLTTPEDCLLLAKSIEQALTKAVPNQIAREYAGANFDKEKVLLAFEDLLFPINS